MTKKSANARFGSAILCNSTAKGEAGKIECKGIFTTFLAWAYPTSKRAWRALVTLFDLPGGTSSVSAAISYGRGKKQTLATIDIDRGDRHLGNVVDIGLVYQFPREGYYTLEFTLVGTAKVLKIPLNVASIAWPRFSKKEIQIVRESKSLPNAIRADVICADCSRPYTFEESILPEHQRADGVLAFPETGVFECESCGREMQLKDIQGQVLNSIKNAVTAYAKAK